MGALDLVPTPKLLFDEGAAPAAPAASEVTIYAKADGLMYSKDDAGVETLMSSGVVSGDVATDTIWTTAGKVAVATGAATATEQWPSGHEFDYDDYTAGNVTVTATTEAGADVIVPGNSVTYDGDPVMVEIFAMAGVVLAGNALKACIEIDNVSQGEVWLSIEQAASGSGYTVVAAKQRLTPSAGAHTIGWAAWKSGGTASVLAGAGGSGAQVPAFIRVTKA